MQNNMFHVKQLPPRDAAVDLLKSIAIVGVLLIHVSAPALGVPPPPRAGLTCAAFDWFAALFWGCVSRGSVPIFLMVTGALMLDPQRELSLKRLWTRYIPRLLAALLAWAFAYQVFHLCGTPGALTPAGLWQAVKNVLLFRHESHLYYLHIALLVYALLPATRLIAAHADRRTMQYLLVLWAILGIVYPTFRGVWPLSRLSGIPLQYALNLTYACVGYTLLGWYLKKYAANWRRWLLPALLGFALVYGGTILLSISKGRLDDTPLAGTSPGVCLMAVGVCGAAFAGLRDRAPGRVARTLSGASFCVYLVHIFFLKALQRLGLTASTGPALLFVPITAAAVLGCSLLVWAVLRRIPPARDWLI